jgi:hypothetical protein
LQQLNLARPKTGGGRRPSVVADSVPFQQAIEEEGGVIDAVDRPKTSAVFGAVKPQEPPRRSQSSAQLQSGSVPVSLPGALSTEYCPRIDSSVSVTSVPSVRRLQFDFLTTWGDQYYAGLTGLEIIVAKPYGSGSQGLVMQFPLELRMMSANPRDINTDGYTGDKRTLDKLIDGVNVTQDDLHMWLIPFTPGSHHTLSIDLDSSQRVLGVSFPPLFPAA